MSRLKIFLIFVVCAVLTTILSLMVLDNLPQETHDERTREIASAGPSMQASLDLVMLRLKQASHEINQSTVPAYLRTFSEYREDLEQLEAHLDSKYPKRNLQAKERQNVVRGKKVLLAQFSERLARNIELSIGNGYFQRLCGRSCSGPKAQQAVKKLRKAWRVEQEDILIKCASFSVNKCAHDLAHAPLAQFWKTFQGQDTVTPYIQLLRITDTRGVGLADLKQVQWGPDLPAAKEFGTKDPTIRRVNVDPQSCWDGCIGVVPSEQLDASRRFLVSSTPILFGEEPLGAFMSGIELTRDFANYLKDSVRLDVVLALRRGADKPEFLAWTLKDEDAHLEIKRSIASVAKLCSGSHETYACHIHRMETSEAETAFFMVGAANFKSAKKQASSLRSTLLLALFILFVLGLIFGVAMLWQTEREYEIIDQGIHDIMAGDRDYEFPFDPEKKTMANSMAQSMNIMLALLLDRPVPDEEVDDERWGRLLVEQADALESGAKTEDELSDEPVDAYYKRTYQEYRQARVTVGEDVSELTYVNFVEKLARLESRLKGTNNARMVRFNVTLQGERVVLTPVFIN